MLETLRVLDLGSGTGILAVAAARLGARSVIALDSSPDAFRTTLATTQLNEMTERVRPLLGDLDAVRDKRFDLIMANLCAETLVRLVDRITALLESGGHLLLSGVLYEESYDVRMKYKAKACVLLKARYLEEYVTLVMRHGRLSRAISGPELRQPGLPVAQRSWPTTQAD